MEELKDILCPFCKNMTSMNKGAHVTASGSGVFLSFNCVHCGEKLTVQTLDKMLMRVNPRVIDTREKT